ncbi:dephospho-coa kinase-related [Holotrichia oblita]|uniref:Dephospho-coa kinase-related n=1 Tax=Holotrichia oblita TaxID=644536 RepID=A0ACB9SRJ7_HOLOL|nr:dephospho-coa kinase-related [Holotrichia oblita]
MEQENIIVLEAAKPKMLSKTALLIVSNPNHVGKILPSLTKHVNKTLYIQLLSALSNPFGSFYPNIFDAWPKFTQTISGIYSQTLQYEDLDVRVLLSGLKYKDMEYIKTRQPIDLVAFDKYYPEDDIKNFIKNRIQSITDSYSILTSDTGAFEELIVDPTRDYTVYKHSVLGGTFDRLHVAHKLLLTEAALRVTEKVTVGVTVENMLGSKTLWELIEPIENRIKGVRDFLEDVNPEIIHNIVPISDMYGPAKDDPTMDVIVVSTETERGGYKVNEMRSNCGLQPLEVAIVDLIQEPNPAENEEAKISSSTRRIRTLGKVIQAITPKEHLRKKPYIIGLTGVVRLFCICSGKSGVGRRLSELGAYHIDCDKVAHFVYEPGKPAYDKIVEAFGKGVVAENGEINRKEIGAIVFKDSKQLEKLNSIVWPAIVEEIQERIKKCKAEVVVLEAAVLLGAGWSKYCHEVWTTVIPPDIALHRLQERNKLSAEEAKSRLASQIDNKKYIEAANVVFYSYWGAEITQKQVDKAWELLLKRIKYPNK